MHILITNDDSHRSPLLEFAIEHFSKLGDVSLVLPLHEQSWTGKSMTRFESVVVESAEIFGRPATLVSGTPADCVNLGVYNLLKKKPDLVVSGINAGFNMGLGFILSSGTVGACLEANLAGIPAVALSQAFDTATRNAYTADYMIEPSRLAMFREGANRVMARLTSALLSEASRAETLACPVTWNVNFPFELTDPRVLCSAPLGMTRYGRVFHKQGAPDGAAASAFSHSHIELVVDPSDDCDSSLIKAGCATVSAISPWSLAGVPADPRVAALLERFTG